VRLATEEEMAKSLTDCEVGAIPPLRLHHENTSLFACLEGSFLLQKKIKHWRRHRQEAAL
jgi:hypothetical protein